MRVNELIEQLKKIPGELEIGLGFWADEGFHLEATYKKKNQDGIFENWGQDDIDFFLTHECKNENYIDKKICIVENKRLEDEDED